jgi:hypothetical protein
MPFGRARVSHRLHDLIFGTEQRGPPLGFRADAPKGLEAIAPANVVTRDDRASETSATVGRNA